MLGVLLPHRQSLRARRHDKGSLPTALECRIHGSHHYVHTGDAAVGDPRLRTVEHPFVVGLVVHGTRAQRRHVGACIGFAHAERPEPNVVRRPVALRHPLHNLLGRAVARDTGRSKAGPHDGHANPRVTPEQFLNRYREREAALVADGVQHELEPIETDLGGLLDDRPGELLTLVPLVSGRPDHVGGKRVDPALDLLLVIIQGERKLCHAQKLPPGRFNPTQVWDHLRGRLACCAAPTGMASNWSLIAS